MVGLVLPEVDVAAPGADIGAERHLLADRRGLVGEGGLDRDLALGLRDAAIGIVGGGGEGRGEGATERAPSRLPSREALPSSAPGLGPGGRLLRLRILHLGILLAGFRRRRLRVCCAELRTL